MSDIIDMVNTKNLIMKHLEINEVQYLQINKVKGLPKKLEKIIVENNLFKFYEKKRKQAVEKNINDSKNKHCAIAQIDPNTKEVLNIYRNMTEAAKAVGITSSHIRHYFTAGSKISGGFQWKKLTPWGKCNICGFEGDYKENFPENGKKNGYQQYKNFCKNCYAAGKHKK